MPCVAEVVNRSLKADCTDYTRQAYNAYQGRGRWKSVSSKIDTLESLWIHWFRFLKLLEFNSKIKTKILKRE